MRRLALAPDVITGMRMATVLTSDPGRLPGVKLIAGVGLVRPGMVRAVVIAVWNGLTP